MPGLEAVCARCAGQHSSTALRLYGTPHTCTTPLGCPPWCLVLLQFKAEKAERAGGSAVTAAEGGETSTFHGKALHDYQGAAVCGCGVWCAAAVSPPPQRPQSRNLTSCTPLLLLLPAGRSWLEAPRDATQRQVDQCFLPKRHVHTWSGHSKGVNAIRCAAAAPGATAWHCSLGAQIAAFGSAATLRFPALTTDLSSPRPRRLQLLPLHRSPAAVCGVGWPDQDVGCGGRQEVHAHLHGAHQGGRGGGGSRGRALEVFTVESLAAVGSLHLRALTLSSTAHPLPIRRCRASRTSGSATTGGALCPPATTSRFATGTPRPARSSSECC